jgi:hypothetical protein
MILAIETSCDDTCSAVVDPEGRKALSNVVHTQKEHARYGGVVPEVASRAHLERLDGVVQRSLSDAEISLDEVTSVAVTVRPGLIGALLVGVAAAVPIMAALSVHRSGGGTTRRVPIFAHRSSRVRRRRVLAATPPVTTTAGASWRFTARRSLRDRASTTAAS